MKPLITIVMPVYNVAPYVERALLSAIWQTYSNLEILVVDDCGPDNSMEIVEETLSKYDTRHCVRILRHDHNRGLSAARNTGLDNMRGEYVYFMDSDDEITPQSIETLVNLALKYPKAEMIQGSTHSIPDEVGDWRDINNKIDYPEYTDDHNWIERHFYALDNFIPVNAWNKLIKRSWIEETEEKLYFKEGIIHEDERWLFDVAERCHAIAFSREITYLHYQTEGSIMTSKAKSNYKSVGAMVQIVGDAIEYMKGTNCSYKLVYLIVLAIERYLIINPSTNEQEWIMPYRKQLWQLLIKTFCIGRGRLCWILLMTLCCPLWCGKGVRYIRREWLNSLYDYQIQF